jgi:two-component system OmpR family sensor kinase
VTMGAALSGPRRWLARRTLRGRLVAGLLATLTLACAAVGALTYTNLHNSLISQLDSDLSQASLRYSQCLNPPMHGQQGGDGHGHGPVPVGNPYWCSQQQNAGAFNAVGVSTVSAPTSAGQVTKPYLANRGSCYLTVAEKAELSRLPVDGHPETITLTGYGSYRLVATSSGNGAVVSGLPLTPVDDTLRQAAIAEVVVFAIALLVAGLIGTAWVRVSLRPLRRVAATATRVTELPLGSGDVAMPERVPDANPRTEVGQLGAAFNHMLGHVESALTRRAASERRLRRFAADASHELRTPLAAIRGYAELARRHPGPVPPDIAHALSRVESESARMSVLVDELLLLAQLDAGRPLASDPVDLTRLIIDVTSDARVAAPDHKWRLELPDEPLTVRGDEHRLHQVLANLLSNAGRHTPAGTTVTVRLSAVDPAPGPSGGDGGGGRPGGVAAGGVAAGGVAAGGVAAGEVGRSAGAVQVAVTDDGPGIPAELQPTMFERFVRGDSSRSRAVGSTGLGLAIVDAVTTAHGGHVTVASRPGQTRFTITLPRLAD